MTHGYRAVSWMPFKKRYDSWLIAGIVTYLLVFVGISVTTQPAGESFTELQILIRATGSLAFLMLSFVLSIGPLARFSERFKPLLFNRRHLGVATFIIALLHAVLVLLWYHGFGTLNPLVSLFASNPRYDALAGFPFESLGFVALLILFLMAATSHDFWNANLGPRLWKSIHMSVYLAFGLVVAHVALGALQFEKHVGYTVLLAIAAVAIISLQLLSAVLFRKPADRPSAGWLSAGLANDMQDGRAVILRPPGAEAIAVFRHGLSVYAVSNACRHQAGPLGEGRIIDDCITCPWHGFQYRLADGASPAPFSEKIATYPTRLVDGYIEVRAEPDAPGTLQTPSMLEATS
ncbi:MAG: ferric reductase-like transmembrane domain-containing protein [Woeseiaceae bacterium]